MKPRIIIARRAREGLTILFFRVEVKVMSRTGLSEQLSEVDVGKLLQQVGAEYNVLQSTAAEEKKARETLKSRQQEVERAHLGTDKSVTNALEKALRIMQTKTAEDAVPYATAVLRGAVFVMKRKHLRYSALSPRAAGKVGVRKHHKSIPINAVNPKTGELIATYTSMVKAGEAYNPQDPKSFTTKLRNALSKQGALTVAVTGGKQHTLRKAQR